MIDQIARRAARRWRDGATMIALFALLLGGAAWLYAQPRRAALPADSVGARLPSQGFYRWEAFADRPGGFRWSEQRARLGLPNPGGPLALDVLLLGGPGRTTAVQLESGGRRLRFAVRPELRRYWLLLPAGAGARVDLAIESESFKDRRRRLGVAMAELRVTGGGALPAQLALGLLLAVAGGYPLLRRCGWRRARAAALLAGLLGLALLWQHAAGWPYALLDRVAAGAGLSALAALAIERRWPPAAAPGERGLVRRPGRADALALAAVLLLALAARLPWLAAPDPVGDLELAARRMGFLAHEGLAGAYTGGGDYMPLRLYILLGLGRLVEPLGGTFHAPLPPATMLLIKLPGLLADLASAALIYAWGRRWRGPAGAAAIALLYALAPPVWINVAWWGQVDALLMLPLLGAVTLLDRAGGRWAWLCWAAALLIKAQAIMLAPLLYLATLRRYGSRGLLANAALLAAALLLAMLPLILAGQGPGLAEAYLGSVERFPRTSYGAYNLWHLALDGDSIPDTWLAVGPLSYRAVGLALLGLAVLLVGLALLARSDGPARAEAAAALALAFFALPTQIHERYLFLCLAFLALALPGAARLLPIYLALVATATLNILGILKGFSPALQPLIASSPLPFLCSLLNLALLAALLARLLLRARRGGPAAAALPAGAQPRTR